MKAYRGHCVFSVFIPLFIWPCWLLCKSLKPRFWSLELLKSLYHHSLQAALITAELAYILRGEKCMRSQHRSPPEILSNWSQGFCSLIYCIYMYYHYILFDSELWITSLVLLFHHVYLKCVSKETPSWIQLRSSEEFFRSWKHYGDWCLSSFEKEYHKTNVYFSECLEHSLKGQY